MVHPKTVCSDGALFAARARALINAHPYFCNRANEFDIELDGCILIVRGSLPSFYLKQLLQNLLKELDGVKRVDNRVQVVCAAGLSSTAPQS
jgi:hypothetical protein